MPLAHFSLLETCDSPSDSRFFTVFFLLWHLELCFYFTPCQRGALLHLLMPDRVGSQYLVETALVPVLLMEEHAVSLFETLKFEISTCHFVGPQNCSQNNLGDLMIFCVVFYSMTNLSFKLQDRLKFKFFFEFLLSLIQVLYQVRTKIWKVSNKLSQAASSTFFVEIEWVFSNIFWAAAIFFQMCMDLLRGFCRLHGI